jgi:hypothetical protein
LPAPLTASEGGALLTADNDGELRRPKDVQVLSFLAAWLHELQKHASASLFAPSLLALLSSSLNKTAGSPHCAPLYRLQADAIRMGVRAGLFEEVSAESAAAQAKVRFDLSRVGYRS